MLNCWKCVKAFCCSDNGKYFALGAAAAVVGLKALKTKKAREICVNGVAQAMKFYDDAREAWQNIKEDAQDICHDAKEAETVEVVE